MERPTCAYCGAKARRDTENLFLQEEEYKGNLKVIRHTLVNYSNHLRHSYSLWDGESYRLDYDPFCKLRCAEKFAKLAYKKGYRIQN